MNELDLKIFHFSREPISIEEIFEKIKPEYKKNLAKKSIYTSIYRLEKLGFITKNTEGKNIRRRYEDHKIVGCCVLFHFCNV